MAAQKTLYVREGSEELWKRAESLAGGSVSALIEDLLRDWINERETDPLFELSEDAQALVTDIMHKLDDFPHAKEEVCFMLANKHGIFWNEVEEIQKRQNDKP